jgi:SPP1 gp7 family putative phage head morphogenesis protein
MSEPIKTPISPGLIDRVVRGVKYMVSGSSNTDWFSPQQPLPPFAQEQAKGRQWDYPVGYNVNIQPRAYEPVSFQQLRALADNLDLLRLVIETRKDLMCKLDFEIKPLDPKAQSDERCTQIREFLRFPDGEHTWDEWLRMLLEDLFVIDAPTVYPRMTLGGGLYALEPIDGSTIKRVIDGTGRTPLPPEVAYQQIIKGVPAVDYSRDELIYKPRNVRTNRVYGYSPVEQIMMTVNIALRRQVSQLQYYSEGSTPDMILSVPETWNPDQTRQFKEWWDAMLSGNTATRRGTMFVPNGVAPINTKEGMLKDEYDEWLARIICYAFSLPVQSLVKEMNRATAETAVQTAKEEGLAPIMQWVKNLVDYLIWKYWGARDLNFVWRDEKTPDALEQAKIDQIYLTAGVLMDDEVRDRLGLEPLSAEQRAQQAEAKMTAAQGAMGGKKEGEPPDEKMEKRLKKPQRVLAPLNRQRKAVSKIRGELQSFIEGKLSAFGKKAARQIVAGYAELTKDDRSKQEAAALIESIELSWDDLVGDLAGYIGAAAKDGVSAAAVQLDLRANISDALSLANDRADDYAKARAAEMVGKHWAGDVLIDNPDAKWRIDESTRTMLRGDVTRAIDEGWSNDKLANAIEDNHAFSFDRAKMIARTETAMADVRGNVEAYKAAESAGMQVLKEWITAEDDLVSEECTANGEAGAIGMDEAFPSGAKWPPQHPNCRCDLLPVLFTALLESHE